MRHSQTIADFPLTNLGEKQVKRSITTMLETDQPDEIYASLLRHARKTAEILPEKTGVNVSEDNRLMEWNNSDLAGLKEK